MWDRLCSNHREPSVVDRGLDDELLRPHESIMDMNRIVQDRTGKRAERNGMTSAQAGGESTGCHPTDGTL
jgi:hypothetical protein